jgi:hypothetical protein
MSRNAAYFRKVRRNRQGNPRREFVKIRFDHFLVLFAFAGVRVGACFFDLS